MRPHPDECWNHPTTTRLTTGNVLSISSPSFSLPSTSYTADTVRNQTIVLKSYEMCILLPGRFRFTPHCVGQAGGYSLPRVSLQPASPAWISRPSKTPGMLQEYIRLGKSYLCLTHYDQRNFFLSSLLSAEETKKASCISISRK